MSCSMYSGLSKSILISSSTTCCSFFTSSAFNLGRNTRSANTSNAIGRCSSSTFALKQICSLEVKASSIPPTESISRAIPSAERRSVPLNTICSRKWAIPFSVAFSRREPLFTQMPTETERTCGIVSVMTIKPLGKTCRRISLLVATIETIVAQGRAGDESLYNPLCYSYLERSGTSFPSPAGARYPRASSLTMELLGKSAEELRDYCVSLGEPAYRGGQIYHAFYRERNFDLAGMTNLPQALRDKLAQEATVTLPRVTERYVSSDGSVRYLLGLTAGAKPASVEAVFMPSERRQTVCISTQAGCAVDCQFCLTAQLGLIRNLTASEIIAQVLL